MSTNPTERAVTAAGGAALDALRDTAGRATEGDDAEGRGVDGRAVLRAGDEPAVARADVVRAGDEDSGNSDANDPGDEEAGDIDKPADTRASAAGRDAQLALAARSSSASSHRPGLIIGPSWRAAGWQAIRL